MSRDELEARARDRSKAEHIRVYKLVDRAEYLAPSRTQEPGSYYRVTVGLDGQPRCECKGYFYRQSCKHIEALRKRLARERK